MGATRERSRMLAGLAAAAGAFGAAAMMSAAASPAARADEFTDLISSVEGDYGFGQTAFTTALSDFASNQTVSGLAALLDGVDDDSLSVQDNIAIGGVEALANDPISSSFYWVVSVPANYADAVSDAQTFIGSGEGFLAQAASDFAGGDYVTAIYDDVLGADYVSILPLEELLLGAAASF